MQKTHKNHMQKLPKKPTKTSQKSSKNLPKILCLKIPQKSFMKILTQKLQKYTKTS